MVFLDENAMSWLEIIYSRENESQVVLLDNAAPRLCRLRIDLAGRPVTEHSMEATGYGIRKAVQVRCFGGVNFRIVDHSAGKLWIA